jgi:hypothetical protein
MKPVRGDYDEFIPTRVCAGAGLVVWVAELDPQTQPAEFLPFKISAIPCLKKSELVLGCQNEKDAPQYGRGDTVCVFLLCSLGTTSVRHNSPHTGTSPASRTSIRRPRPSGPHE